jgi:hypothetical protein
MPDVGFQLVRVVQLSICGLMIGALFFGGLSLDDQFDLPLGHVPGTILSQVAETDLDDFRLKELSTVFMLALVLIACRHVVLKDSRCVTWAARSRLPILPFQLLSAYRI